MLATGAVTTQRDASHVTWTERAWPLVLRQLDMHCMSVYAVLARTQKLLCFTTSMTKISNTMIIKSCAACLCDVYTVSTLHCVVRSSSEPVSHDVHVTKCSWQLGCEGCPLQYVHVTFCEIHFWRKKSKHLSIWKLPFFYRFCKLIFVNNRRC